MSTDTRINAKGDTYAGVGDNEVGIVSVGQPGQVYTADPTKLTGVSWQNPASGVTHKTTGPFIGRFGPCGNAGTWTVCPAAFRVSVAAASGVVLDWRFGAVLGAETSSADAEFDLASIDNSVPGSPVILRCLSSGTNTPLTNGMGSMYCWANNARRLPSELWEVQAGDIVSGTVTLALLYRANATGLSVGHTTVYPNRVTLTNIGGT